MYYSKWVIDYSKFKNSFYMFFLICYYFESDEEFDSPLVNMHKIFLRNMVRKDADGLFSPNSTLG